MRFGHLAQRLFNTPLAIRPEKAEMIMAVLADRLGVAQLFRDGHGVSLAPRANVWWDDDDDLSGPVGPPDLGYDVVAGIACIPVEGTLVQRSANVRPSSGMMGYNGIRQAFLTALGDPEVRAIALQMDSPGGEVAGMLDLADTIRAGRGVKPIWSILDERAFSAAYCLACAADRITIPRTGGAGSIGVIAMHVDLSQALSDAGLKVTLVTYGDRKADGHGEIPLSPEAHAAMEADIATVGALFDSTVAANRGLTQGAVRAMQAGTFMGEAAVKAGLADAVMAPDAAFRALLATLG